MINGVINVRKEKGMTSFGVVSRLRRIFNQKKIGHTGTLDPDAEGVLPVCFGRATGLVETLSQGTKTYEAVLLLGRVTDTQDTSGKILEEHPFETDSEKIREVILSFAGKQMQLPPMYSALKVNGQKLVDLARRGIEVERKEREVEFSEFEILRIEPPHAVFRVTCTHGAYIRTLCHDIGRKLGCGGCMESLLRTRVGRFPLEEAMTLSELEEAKSAADECGEAYSFVRAIDSFYEDAPKLTVPEDLKKTALNGGSLPTSLLLSPEMQAQYCGGNTKLYRLYTENDGFIGVYEKRGGLLKLVKYYYEDHS